MRHLFGMALLAMTMACGNTAARAAETEYDPAKVSESLKAIFQFGSVATKQALNANTVTLISGTIGGTYVQFGADLASVLDDGNKLRVLPIVGRGSVQSVADILFLQGVDLGIVRADTLDYLEKKGFAKDIKKQFTYVTKLYNEEMHVVASKSITQPQRSRGQEGQRRPSQWRHLRHRGDRVRAARHQAEVRLHRAAHRDGEDEGRRDRRRDRLRRQAVQVRQHVSRTTASTWFRSTIREPLQNDYLPATLTSKDYPNLIAEGQKVDTIAVPAVLAAYNWAPNTERYRKLAAVRGRVLHEVSDVPEPAVPPEVEGSLAVGAAAGLAAPAGRRAMAQEPQRRGGDARQVR